MLNGLVINENGVKYRYKNSRLHCLDGPAVELVNGTKYWFKNGRYHRLDGPAIENADGSLGWYKNGILLGVGNKGFWDLWETLTDEQRNNLDLLMWMPKS